MDELLGRYDAAAVRRFLVRAGVLQALERKGFRHFQVLVDMPAPGLPRVRLLAVKAGQVHLLLDARVTETTVRPTFFRDRGLAVDGPIVLAMLYWVREQDPTAAFSPDRPPLPLQHHPGLGILRRAFNAIAAMARQRGLDGVACIPKFFHDAVLFFRSRLFLFLDGTEQGRFEALMRDLSSISLPSASLALLEGAVIDDEGQVLHWSAGYEVCPLSELLLAYFNSPRYAAQVGEGLRRFHFTIDSARLDQTSAQTSAEGRT